MSASELLQHPVWHGSELGRPIPDNIHAVSVALPRWQDVVGCEEKRPEVMSLVPVLRDPAARVRDHAYHAFPRQRDGQPVIGRAIRTERHRLVEWKQPGKPADTADLELYDYQTDPKEMKNLAGDQPKTVARLRTILARHPEAKPPIR
jgi:arylsulfatase A-like enzyme